MAYRFARPRPFNRSEITVLGPSVENAEAARFFRDTLNGITDWSFSLVPDQSNVWGVDLDVEWNSEPSPCPQTFSHPEAARFYADWLTSLIALADCVDVDVKRGGRFNPVGRGIR